jgi:hypothetical protein
MKKQILFTAILSVLAPLNAGALETFLPKEAKVTTLFQLQKAPSALQKAARESEGLGVMPSGVPVLFAGDWLVPLTGQTRSKSLRPVRLKNGLSLGRAIVSSDGSLLAVSGKEFGVMNPSGFKKILALPGEGMKVASAGKDHVYLYGGRSEEQSRDLFLYRRDRKAAKIFRAPVPITAVTGDGSPAYIALGPSVYRFSSGKPLALVLQAEGDVVEMSMAGTGFFYATSETVGYWGGAGKSFVFLKDSGAVPRGGGQSLFLLLGSGDVIKCSPLTAFSNVAAKIKRAAPKKAAVQKASKGK